MPSDAHVTPPENQALVFRGGKWVDGRAEETSAAVRFRDIRFYRGNLVDYLRVAMCFAAAVTMGQGLPLATAILILTSILLDWVDGPVARAYDQCTLFGSGIDWLADNMASVLLMVWWVTLDRRMIPLLMVSTSIEIATGLLDFALTARGTYPKMPKQRGALVILQWSMPGGSYTWFGTFLWLAYPFFIAFSCLSLAWTGASHVTSLVLDGGRYLLLVPAVMYVWCELAYLLFLLGRWTEPARQARAIPAPLYTDGPSGCALVETVEEGARDLLRSIREEAIAKLGAEWTSCLTKKEIFWVNVWQRSDEGAKLAIEHIDELDAWARALVDRHYAGEDVVLDGYGLMVNPAGSSTQPWHVDYSLDYSTLFITLSALTPENSMQYVAVPPTLPKELYARSTANLDRVDVAQLVEKGDWVSVRQLLAPPFSVIRLDFGAIHRGIANQTGIDRVGLWISVKRAVADGGLLPKEPLIEKIHERGVTS